MSEIAPHQAEDAPQIEIPDADPRLDELRDHLIDESIDLLGGQPS